MSSLEYPRLKRYHRCLRYGGCFARRFATRGKTEDVFGLKRVVMVVRAPYLVARLLPGATGRLLVQRATYGLIAYGQLHAFPCTTRPTRRRRCLAAAAAVTHQFSISQSIYCYCVSVAISSVVRMLSRDLCVCYRLANFQLVSKIDHLG